MHGYAAGSIHRTQEGDSQPEHGTTSRPVIPGATAYRWSRGRKLLHDPKFENETTLVFVSQYLPGMLTGGGYTVNPASGDIGVSPGQSAGDPGLNTNFGFKAKTTQTTPEVPRSWRFSRVHRCTATMCPTCSSAPGLNPVQRPVIGDRGRQRRQSRPPVQR